MNFFNKIYLEYSNKAIIYKDFFIDNPEMIFLKIKNQINTSNIIYFMIIIDDEYLFISTKHLDIISLILKKYNEYLDSINKPSYILYYIDSLIIFKSENINNNFSRLILF